MFSPATIPFAGHAFRLYNSLAGELFAPIHAFHHGPASCDGRCFEVLQRELNYNRYYCSKPELSRRFFSSPRV